MNQNDPYIRAKRYSVREVQTYEVLVTDFDNIESEATNVGTDLTFAVACISVAITIALTLLSVPIPSGTVFTIFSAFLAVCAILGLNFAVKAYRQRGRLKKLMQKIREYQTLPLGEKGGELGAAELGNLPSEEGGEAR